MPRHFKCEMLNDEKLKDLYSPFFQAVLTKVSSEWPLGFREFLRWSNQCSPASHQHPHYYMVPPPHVHLGKFSRCRDG